MTTVKEDVEYSKSKMYSTPPNTLFGAFNNDTKIKYVPQINAANASNMQYFVKGCSNLKTVPKINVSSKCTTFAYAFQNSGVEYLDLSTWDTSGATTMISMFANCKNLKRVDVSEFNTSKITNMSGMFNNCESIESLDLSNFDMSNVVNINGMFYGSRNISLDSIKDWNMEKVEDISSFLWNDISDEEIVLNWKTPNLKSIDWSFSGQKSRKVKKVDISSLDLSNVTNMTYTFRYTYADIIKVNGLGTNPDVNINNCFAFTLYWGETEEGLQSIRDTLINNSFDRAAAGYSALNLGLPKEVQARLTDEEKAAITAKGFTIV
jgi:surface protein